MERLILVSNRLPFTYERRQESDHFKPSLGGLVTALSGYFEEKRKAGGFSCLWMGWPGASVEESRQGALREKARDEFGALPVFLSADEMGRFYLGFCNRTLWPLFHYFPNYTSYDPDFWESYSRINERFCEALVREARPGDVIWVHDYHLLLLPGMLREKLPEARIGFFLHIPFPSFELFRMLPRRWREGLLRGMLGADLV